MPFAFRPFDLTIKEKKNGNNSLKNSIALEVLANGLDAISFNTGISNSYSQNDKSSVLAGMVPIHFPKHLKYVPDPLGNSSGAYDKQHFKQIAKGSPNRSINAMLVHNHIPKKSAPKEIIRMAANNQSTHPCSLIDDKIKNKKRKGDKLSLPGMKPLDLVGGRACSWAVHRESNEPITFYSNQKAGKGAQIPIVKKGKPTTTNRLDHFFIPTVMESGSVVWVAIQRFDDHEVNKENLSKWIKQKFTVAGFNEYTFERDEIGMRIAFDAKPMVR